MGRWGDELFREAYAFGPQSTVADYTNRALIKVHDYDFNGNVEVLHQCHDEILSLVKKEYINEYIKIVKPLIEQSFWCETGMLTIPVDIKVGKTWGTSISQGK